MRTVGASLTVCGLALGLRAVHAAWMPEQYATPSPFGAVQGLALLAGFTSSMGAGFGFVLACLERTVQQMTHLAGHDGLTGCLNRTSTHNLLSHMLERCRRDTQPIALVLFDLDHFKQINDDHGHLVGDQVLRVFADAVRVRLRASDLFGRVGGEEFCLGLPDTDRQGALQVVESVREAVEALRLIGRDGLPLQVTVSAGLAVAELDRPQPVHAGLSVEGLYGQADRQLYLAKAGGRNRAMLA